MTGAEAPEKMSGKNRGWHDPAVEKLDRDSSPEKSEGNSTVLMSTKPCGVPQALIRSLFS